MTLATSATRLRYHVRLIHASTGDPITGLTARLPAAPHGWTVRTVPDGVVVSARTDVADPPVPAQLVVTLTDGVLADLILLPPTPGLPPRTVLIDLTAPEVELELHPVPMTLTVDLVTPSTGKPRTGAAVSARATSGPTPLPTVGLPEVAPGVYRSAPVEWTAPFTPADLLVEGNLLRALRMDLRSASTHIRLIDTT
jgi:hypothetical protein